MSSVASHTAEGILNGAGGGVNDRLESGCVVVRHVEFCCKVLRFDVLNSINRYL